MVVEIDIVTKRGSFYSYGDLRLAQGRENAKNFLVENPDIAEEIDGLVRQEMLGAAAPAAMEAGEFDDDI